MNVLNRKIIIIIIYYFKVREHGCGESIKDFLALGFRGSVLGGFGFYDLKRPHKPRLQNRCGLGIYLVFEVTSVLEAATKKKRLRYRSKNRGP